MSDFFSATPGQIIVTIFATLLAWFTYREDKKWQKDKKIRQEQERELFKSKDEIVTTYTQFERHLSLILNLVATKKLKTVTLTDDKEVPQSVLISYWDYKTLLAFKILHEGNTKEEERELWQKEAEELSRDKQYMKELREFG